MLAESSANKATEPQPPADHSRSQPRGWGPITGTLWVILAYFGPSLVIGPLLPLLVSWQVGTNTKQSVLRFAFELLTLLIIVGIIRAYRLRLGTIGLGRFDAKFIKYAAIAFPVYLIGSVIAVNVTARLFQFNLEQTQELGFRSVSGLDLVLVFVALVVLAPIVEEILFRGFLLRAYKPLGPIAGSLLVSLLFAVAHGQVNVGIDVFVLSLALCYLRIKTDSLWPCIMLHALKNLVAFSVVFIINAR